MRGSRGATAAAGSARRNHHVVDRIVSETVLYMQLEKEGRLPNDCRSHCSIGRETSDADIDKFAEMRQR